MLDTRTALEAVSDILFPIPNSVLVDGDPILVGGGASLRGLLIDLDRNSGDPVIFSTLTKVQKQLDDVAAVRREAGIDVGWKSARSINE